MMKFYRMAILGILLALPQAAQAETPLTTDSRIKTFIFNENDVYRMVLHFGYQSSIEFGNGEEVETMSIGDSYAWKITPIGRRLFIKPMEENAHTNVTIITNKRTYQFDLLSRRPSEKVDNELVYVVRFYYPDENNGAVAPVPAAVMGGGAGMSPMQGGPAMPAMPAGGQLMAPSMPMQGGMSPMQSMSDPVMPFNPGAESRKGPMF